MRRPLRFHSYDDVWADAKALTTSGYERAGSWSLGQVCDHLARTMELSLDGFPSMFPWPVRLAARWFVLGKVMKHRPYRRQFRAPSYLLPATDEDQAGLEQLRKAIDRLKNHAGEMWPHPVFGQLTPNEWQELHLWHCEHHFSFLHPRDKLVLPP
jgi:Protein of unknown function (DUF1569)